MFRSTSEKQGDGTVPSEWWEQYISSMMHITDEYSSNATLPSSGVPRLGTIDCFSDPLLKMTQSVLPTLSKSGELGNTPADLSVSERYGRRSDGVPGKAVSPANTLVSEYVPVTFVTCGVPTLLSAEVPTYWHTDQSGPPFESPSDSKCIRLSPRLPSVTKQDPDFSLKFKTVETKKLSVPSPSADLLLRMSDGAATINSSNIICEDRRRKSLFAIQECR